MCAGLSGQRSIPACPGNADSAWRLYVWAVYSGGILSFPFFTSKYFRDRLGYFYREAAKDAKGNPNKKRKNRLKMNSFTSNRLRADIYADAQAMRLTSNILFLHILPCSFLTACSISGTLRLTMSQSISSSIPK